MTSINFGKYSVKTSQFLKQKCGFLPEVMPLPIFAEACTDLESEKTHFVISSKMGLDTSLRATNECNLDQY